MKKPPPEKCRVSPPRPKLAMFLQVLTLSIGVMNMMLPLGSPLSSAPKRMAHGHCVALTTRVNATLKVPSITEAKAVTATV